MLPRVIQYLEAENAYGETALANTQDLQSKLFEEAKARIEEDKSTYPWFRQGYYYHSRMSKGEEYPVYYRQKGSLESPVEKILDVNELARDHEFFAIGDYEVSPDGKQLVYSQDVKGRNQFQPKLKDLSSKKIRELGVENIAPYLEWAADNRHIFYLKREPKTLRYYQLYRFDTVKGKN